MEKNIVKMTAKELIALGNKEIARQFEINNSNSSKAIVKVSRLQDCLKSVPAETVLTVEGCRGDAERGYSFPNAGSIVECVVKYHFCGHPAEVSKTFPDIVDMKMGCIPCEVKASLTCNALATPSEAEFTLLVNARGAWMIRKDSVLSACKETKAGYRLRHDSEEGFRVNWLSELLGCDEW